MSKAIQASIIKNMPSTKVDCSDSCCPRRKRQFHDIFGNIEWTDEDKVKKQINDIIESVRKDERYNNAMQYSDKQNARDESDRAAHEAVLNSMQSGLELFREVQNNPSFRKWLFDSAFNSTYQTNSQQHP